MKNHAPSGLNPSRHFQPPLPILAPAVWSYTPNSRQLPTIHRPAWHTGRAKPLSCFCIRDQVAVLRISFKQALAFQKTPNPLGDGVRQSCQMLAGRRLDPTEPGCSIGALHVHAIEQQRRTFGHAPRSTAGTETSSITTEGNQVPGVTRLAVHPQRAVFQPAAFEVVLEFTLYIARQSPVPILAATCGMIRVLATLCFYTVYRLAESSLTISRNACRCQTFPVIARHSHSIVNESIFLFIFKQLQRSIFTIP